MQDDLLERIAVAELVYFERYWRDRGMWAEMKTAYHPQSLVRVAWFQGTGPEFVEASKGIHRQGLSKHRLSPAIVRGRGDRGIAETDAIIETRTQLGEVAVDTAAHCRLLSRVRKDDGVWRLASLDCIYEKDTLRPVNPSRRLEIDEQRLSRGRPSYQFLCYNLETLGRPVNLELPGVDRPDLIQALYAEADAWLDGKD